MYNSINDAKTELLNSGVLEMFEFESLDDVAEFMYRNDANPEQSAIHFGVL